MEKFRIGLFTSAWDQVAWELVEKVYQNVQNDLIPNSEIVFVFVSRDEGETRYGDLMIRNVRAVELPLITFSSLRFKPELRERDREAWRLEHDREVMNFLPPTDLIVLLGYMWWFSKEMCQKRPAINLHPALPEGPKGTYRDVIWQLIKGRATKTGVMMHLVTPELDRGPVITSCHFSIRGKTFNSSWQEIGKRLKKATLEEMAKREGEDYTLFKLIRQKGVIREFPMISWTIKTLAEKRIRIENGKVVDFQGQVLESGYDLTSKIDAAVKDKV